MSSVTNKGITISSNDTNWGLSKPANGVMATIYNSTSTRVKSIVTLTADSTVKNAVIDISLSSFGSNKNGIYVTTDTSYIGSFVGDELGDFKALVYGNKQYTYTNKYTWNPSSIGKTIYLVYVGYETPNDNVSIIVTPTSSNQTYYFNIEVYDNSGTTAHAIIGASVNFFTPNGTVFLTSKTTNALGAVQYSTSNYSSCLCRISETGYNNKEIRIAGTTTNSNNYKRVYLTPNDPSILTTDIWSDIDAERYVGKGATYARGVRLSDSAGIIIDRQRMLTYSDSDSGTAIVELYAHKRKNDSQFAPRYGLYDIESGSFSRNSSYVFDFTNMSPSPDFNGKPSNGDRIIYSTHCIYGKNWNSNGNLAVAATGSSAENQFIYNNVTVAKDKWASYTDYNGVKYYSITVDENNHKSYTTLSVKKDYKYTFLIFTRSQVEVDGIAITEGILTSAVSSLSDVANALKTSSGINVTDNYIYNATEDKTLYIYFLTDATVLGDIDTSTGITEDDKYCYADIKVTEEPNGTEVKFMSAIQCTIEGTKVSGEDIYTKIYKSGDSIILPRPYAYDGVRYCDKWNDPTVSQSWSVGVDYTGKFNYDGGILLAEDWLEKSKITLPASFNVVYNGSVQFISGIPNTLKYIGVQGATDVGNYDGSLSIKDSEHFMWSDNTVDDKDYTWSITRRPITITAKPNSKTYDGTAIQVNGSTASNIVSGHTYTCTLTRAGNGINAGTYKVTPSAAVIKDASGNNVTGNYNITYASNTLTVNKKTVDINYSTITSSTVYCTDTAEDKASLVSVKSVTLASSAWTIEGGGAITYTLQVNSGSSTVSGWSLSSDGKTLTVPPGTAAGTYNVSITIYAAESTNYNPTSDLKQIVVNVMATSISSYGSVSAPVYTQKSDFPASGVVLTASNIGSYLTPSGSSQMITYNNGATRNGSISYVWSGSYNVSNLDTDNIDRKSLTLTGLTCTAMGEGGESTGDTPTGYQEKNKIESISLTLTPSTIKYGASSVPSTKATYTSGGTKNVTATYTSSDTNVAKVE